MLAPLLTRRLLERFVKCPAPGLLSLAVAAQSERDLDILRLVARGLPNAEIGAQLHPSLGSVKTYVSCLLSRLHLRGQVQQAVLAYESGLVTPGR